MKNVLDLKENEVIHCETEEQSKRLCELFDNLGLKWRDGDSYKSRNPYITTNGEFCYKPATGEICTLEFYKSNGYIIHKATDFLNNNDMEKRNIELDLNTAKEWYSSENETLKELALQTFPELKKKQLPKRWNECTPVDTYYISHMSNVYPTQSLFCTGFISPNKNNFKTAEQAEASIALAQLSIARDEYRQGWMPDWENNTQPKHCIILKNKKFILDELYETNYFLSFQTQEIAAEFLNNFKELIEQARPLMS